MTKSLTQRLPMLDCLRGIAVLLMILFHFCFDLDHFGLISVDWTHPFWWTLPRLIVFIFLLCVGLSQSLSSQRHFQWSKVIKRFSLIGALAISISLLTYIVFPHRWVVFGTLHCIALSGILSLPLVHRPQLALLVAAILIFPSTVSRFYSLSLFDIPLSSWVFPPHRASIDHIPIVPWFGVVCLGLFFGHTRLMNFLAHSSWPSPFSHSSFGLLLWLGRFSLPIYLSHQLILFPLCYLLTFFKKIG